MELMMVVCVVLCVVSYWYGYSRGVKSLYEAVMEDIRKKKELVSKNLIQVYVEKVGDTFYVYRKSDNKYLVQGKSVEDLDKQIMTNYPGLLCEIDKDSAIKAGL